MLYRDAKAIILVFDVSSKDSYESLEKWHKSVVETAPANVIEVIVGNKVDLDLGLIEFNQANELATRIKAKLFFVSAKTGEGIDEIFYDIADRLCKNKLLCSFKEKTDEGNSSFALSQTAGKRKKKLCC